MEDTQIIDLYFARSEQAIQETDNKYGGYCYSIAYNILANREDSEESVSDTYMAAWKHIPPRRPAILAAFLGKITRHLSLDRWRSRNAYKRGGGEVPLALEELQACISDGDTPEEALARKELALVINRFLDSLEDPERSVFLCRYWYLDPIERIAQNFGFSHSKVTSMLHRTRQKLKTLLVKEGVL